MARIKVLSCEPHEVRFCITKLDENYAADDRYIDLYFGGTYVGTYPLLGGVYDSDIFCAINLPAFKIGTVKAIIYYNGGSVTCVENITTRPEYFEFDTPKIKGKDYRLTPDEWNGLCENINQVVEWVGKSPVYYSPAKEGKDFLADIFNDVRNGLLGKLFVHMTDEDKALFETLVRVKPEDPVKAHYLNAMRDIVNSIKYPYE